MSLPDRLVERRLRRTDAAAVTALMAAQEKHDLGEVLIDEADIVGDWERPSFDLASQTVGVFDAERLVAYAEYSGADRGDAAVHPDYRGRRIGTALAMWMQQCARAHGAKVVGLPVPAGTPGQDLLLALGYEVRWTSWTLALPPGREIAARPLPGGYEIRPADGAADRRAAWTVTEDAFLEWAVRDRSSFEDWSSRVTGRPGFAPWNLRLLTDPDGEVVGAVHIGLSDGSGFVHQLAVRPDQRGLGLATALLTDAFAAARAHGAVRSELSTDSRSGALGLYERVGMQVTSTWLNLAKTL